jgi:hypothetical protein
MELEVTKQAEADFRLIATEDDGTRTDLGFVFPSQHAADRTRDRYLDPRRPLNQEKLAARLVRAKEKAARPRTETRKQMGSITVMRDGKPVEIPAELIVHDTYYPGTDRKDVVIEVPRLVAKPKVNQPEG